MESSVLILVRLTGPALIILFSFAHPYTRASTYVSICEPISFHGERSELRYPRRYPKLWDSDHMELVERESLSRMIDRHCVRKLMATLKPRLDDPILK